METTIYTLRKINPNRWSGIQMYVNANSYIGPSLDMTGLPVTGLTEDSQFTNSKGHTEIKEGTRTKFEKLLGMEEGMLKQRSDFWPLYSVRVGMDDLKLNPDIPDHALQIEFLKAQKGIVANGAKNIHSQSEYVLFTESAEVEERNKEGKTKRSAYALFEQLTADDMREVLEMTGVRTASLAPSIIEGKLSDFMEEYHQKFIALVKDPNRKNQSFVRQCLDRGVLEIDNGMVMFNEVVLGIDIAYATIALFSDEHAKTRESIKVMMGITPEGAQKQSKKQD